MTNLSTIEKIKSLTDEGLMQLMKQNSIFIGPILPTTRNIYEWWILEQLKNTSYIRAAFEQTWPQLERKMPGKKANLPSMRYAYDGKAKSQLSNQHDAIYQAQMKAPSNSILIDLNNNLLEENETLGFISNENIQRNVRSGKK